MPKTIFIDIIVLQNHEILEEKLGLEMWVCTSWGSWVDKGPLGITLYDVKLRKSAFEEVVDCVQIDGENSTITIMWGC